MSLILFIALLILEVALLIIVLSQIFGRDFRIWPPPKGKSATMYWALGIFYLLILGNIWLCVLQWSTPLFEMSWIRYFGGALLGLGLILYGWCRVYMSKKVEFGNKDHLITQGPYQYTRNPLYVADTLIFIGFALVGNSLLLIVLMILLVQIILLLPLIEEPWLLEQYGERYRSYMRNTPRFFKTPAFGGKQRSKRSQKKVQ